MNKVLKDTRQLLRLRNMRVELAQIAMQQAYAAHEAAKQAVQHCKDAITACADEIKSVHTLMHDNPQLHAVRFLELTESKLKNLKARSAKAEEQLLEAITEEEEAAQRLSEAVTVLALAMARRDGVAEQFRKAKQKISQQQEEFQMLELEDSRRMVAGGAR